MKALAAAGGYAGLFALVLGSSERYEGFAWELAAFAVLMSYPLALLCGFGWALGARARHGILASAPLVLLLGAVGGVPVVRWTEAALRDRDFTRHVAALEALLVRTPLESGGRLRLPVDSLPTEVRSCCARAVFVRRDDAGQLSAMVVGYRRTSYLYDPSGTRLQRSLAGGRWKSHELVAPHWYRMVRF